MLRERGAEVTVPSSPWVIPAAMDPAWGITHCARGAGLRAGTVVVNWKGKGISQPPSQTPAVAVLQVCEAAVPSTGISPSWSQGVCSPTHLLLPQQWGHPHGSCHL